MQLLAINRGGYPTGTFSDSKAKSSYKMPVWGHPYSEELSIRHSQPPEAPAIVGPVSRYLLGRPLPRGAPTIVEPVWSFCISQNRPVISLKLVYTK